MRIDVEVTGIGAGESRFDKEARAVERYSRAVQEAVQASSNLSGAGGITDASGGVYSRTGKRLTPAPGPLERFQTAQAHLDVSPDDFDTRVRARRAQIGLDRAEKQLTPTTTADRIWDAVGTSRIGVGPGGAVMPLVNRLGGILGGLSASSGLAIAGIALLGATAKASAERIREYGPAQSMTGGTAGDVSGLAAHGIDPSRMAGLAAAFRQRISLETADPYALGAAAELGIRPQLGRNFGPQNEARMLNEALDRLHQLGPGDRQLRLARQLGLDAELDSINVSDDIWRKQQEDAARRSEGLASGSQVARDMEASRNRLKNAWEGATSPIGKWWAGVERWFTDDLADTLSEGRVPFTNFKTNPSRGTDSSAVKTPAVQATEDNTRAIREWSKMMGRMVGGGSRADAAFPIGLRGNFMAINAAARGAITKGAWKL